MSYPLDTYYHGAIISMPRSLRLRGNKSGVWEVMQMVAVIGASVGALANQLMPPSRALIE